MIGIQQIKNFRVNGKPIGLESRKNLMRIIYAIGIEKNQLSLENQKLRKEIEELKKEPNELRDDK